MAALRTVLGFLAENSGKMTVGRQFDTNAIGESWAGAAMHHWVDRAGGAALGQDLERQLMALEIGGKTGRDGRRLAAQELRLARDREALAAPAAPEDGMVHWADRPAAIKSPEQLEQQLVETAVGGLAGAEGRRLAMRAQRLAAAEGPAAAGPPAGRAAEGGGAASGARGRRESGRADAAQQPL